MKKPPKKSLRAFEIIREVQLLIDMGSYINGDKAIPERKAGLQAAALKMQRRYILQSKSRDPDAKTFQDLLAGALAYLKVISRARGESLPETLEMIEAQMMGRGVSW